MTERTDWTVITGEEIAALNEARAVLKAIEKRAADADANADDFARGVCLFASEHARDGILSLLNWLYVTTRR